MSEQPGFFAVVYEVISDAQGCFVSGPNHLHVRLICHHWFLSPVAAKNWLRSVPGVRKDRNEAIIPAAESTPAEAVQETLQKAIRDRKWKGRPPFAP